MLTEPCPACEAPVGEACTIQGGHAARAEAVLAAVTRGVRPDQVATVTAWAEREVRKQQGQVAETSGREDRAPRSAFG
ncbi:hypothetical protein P3T27_007498 [Kitasatospora sp. MAA19]|uniref:hypothetical protein n=1 Tax=unclassified Kitasatospora TaxID=2633591 RepID=UPI002473A112|nr:hypothetical protein [Kitasatospora sp. MAA19]MDH6710747.1 hypothetical protein [Kitasatospora sp. MAA19]